MNGRGIWLNGWNFEKTELKPPLIIVPFNFGFYKSLQRYYMFKTSGTKTDLFWVSPSCPIELLHLNKSSLTPEICGFSSEPKCLMVRKHTGHTVQFNEALKIETRVKSSRPKSEKKENVKIFILPVVQQNLLTFYLNRLGSCQFRSHNDELWIVIVMTSLTFPVWQLASKVLVILIHVVLVKYNLMFYF